MSNCQPVEMIPGDAGRQPEDGVGLCLSGGGYRAMLFHVGTLWRLYEAGCLAKLKRISSVSGGSIAAAQLGMSWNEITPGTPDPAKFQDKVVVPIRRLASKTIDVASALAGAFWFGSINDKVADAYRKYLYGNKTLQDLPDEPRFVINATNVQSGALWRFMKPYMRDWRVGEIKNPTVALAVAVGASSAFPPFLSPATMDLDPDDFTSNSGKDLQEEPFTSEAVLSDGGVYDNLGLETVWKRYKTVLVSDAGGKMQPQGEPKKDWARHSYRVLELIDNQVRALRKRQVIGSYKSGSRTGAYWGIRTDISNYELNDCLPCSHQNTLELANTPTRLKRLPAVRQERLINWGYAACDAAVRKYVDPHIPAPAAFPYPNAGVGA